MDMDMKPRVQAPTSTTPAGPTPNRTPLPDMDMGGDPFKTDPPKAAGPYVSKKHRGGAGKKVLLVLLAILVLAGVGGGVYYWQNQKVKELNAQVNDLNSQINAMQSRMSSNQTEAAVSTATDDQLVLEAAQAACLTVDDPANAQPLAFKIGTIGANKKEIVYTANKNYASLNATCGPTANPGASQTFYVEKTSNGTWITTYYGAAAPDAAVTKKFGIPAANTFN